jgi:hypothetical protein
MNEGSNGWGELQYVLVHHKEESVCTYLKSALVVLRVSSKQTKNIFGLNRKEPKLNLFRLFFGLFHETKKYLFWFVSVFRTCIETIETNILVSKHIETNQKKCVDCTSTCTEWTRPGAAQISARWTRTGAAKTLEDMSGAVQSSCRQTRRRAAQALEDRHVQVRHKAFVDEHAGAAQAIVEGRSKCSESCWRLGWGPDISGSTDCCRRPTYASPRPVTDRLL